jgi:hypothetical protein
MPIEGDFLFDVGCHLTIDIFHFKPFVNNWLR